MLDGWPTVLAWAWGPGAAWLLASLPGLLGADDDQTGFRPVHPLLAEMDRRYPHLRIGRSGRVFEALVPAVLEQKVVGAEARRAWRTLMLKFGEPPPGPAPPGMRVFPPARTWARIPSWDWHRAGVEGVRAQTVIGAAHVAERLEEIVAMTSAEADLRLRSLPGIGPWTSAEMRQRACGDADAVSVGDVHLPGAVGWALAGRKVDDAGMLELLAPYAGHRHRAARLVVLSGHPAAAPRPPAGAARLPRDLTPHGKPVQDRGLHPAGPGRRGGEQARRVVTGEQPLVQQRRVALGEGGEVQRQAGRTRRGGRPSRSTPW